ncbi:hypothetical protein [Neobacillus terrae]|nr:hypothetical protein [Neobacillus terrae]NHM32521.1 hypothetical protein [Neobacillus terrae]
MEKENLKELREEAASFKNLEISSTGYGFVSGNPSEKEKPKEKTKQDTY